MVPEPEGDKRLRNLVSDKQSIHSREAVKKINFITKKLVESINANKDKLKADIPKLLNLYQRDTVRIGLLSITENKKRSVMEKTPELYSPDDKKFIETVINRAKQALEEQYLKKDRG